MVLGSSTATRDSSARCGLAVPLFLVYASSAHKAVDLTVWLRTVRSENDNAYYVMAVKPDFQAELVDIPIKIPHHMEIVKPSSRWVAGRGWAGVQGSGVAGEWGCSRAQGWGEMSKVPRWPK